LQTKGAAADPVWSTLSLEDLGDVNSSITEAQGQILYHDGSQWDALDPGDSGQFLKTQGSGADPIWADTLSSTLSVDVHDLHIYGQAYFEDEYDNGNSGTADTIDWGNGNKQKSTLTDNCTFTFNAHGKPCNLVLNLVQDATGSRTVTWPASVKWPAGTAPTLSTGANAVDIITFYYDGTSYHGNSSLNFS